MLAKMQIMGEHVIWSLVGGYVGSNRRRAFSILMCVCVLTHRIKKGTGRGGLLLTEWMLSHP
jgi:hypothetical protein